jgi:hypothetical protein
MATSMFDGSVRGRPRAVGERGRPHRGFHSIRALLAIPAVTPEPGGLAAAPFPQIDGLHGWASEPRWPRPRMASIRGSALRSVDRGY